MDRAGTGDTVAVIYTGTLEDGTIFDRPEEPRQVTIGAGEINQAFEEALVGMAPGETKKVVLPAERAYGPYRKNLVFRLKRRDLHLPEEPVPGGTARISLKGGTSTLVTVLKADRKTVTVDANHPLAGKDLTFAITLVEICRQKSG
ncbi:FKBP-type peptidyl-prolyl cis-trans isomerase [Methanofollis tationis]|uniref:Peptidyl-prolyl cis-trans isomerase n=1 Tax=Methanofollis tationis TaxID=81417 RepID=A0A7K4HKX7_9EURY|nr:FKBP-type peptidyl-prolyl cis-trans isomerase [Methanofollis tationis]NVO65926.1 FKBP-type peptidyl-prolyl cis-trans isomerase [Methanofollis tationis]